MVSRAAASRRGIALPARNNSESPPCPLNSVHMRTPLTPHAHAEAGKDSPYDIRQAWMFILRCCCFVWSFFAVWIEVICFLGLIAILTVRTCALIVAAVMKRQETVTSQFRSPHLTLHGTRSVPSLRCRSSVRSGN